MTPLTRRHRIIARGRQLGGEYHEIKKYESGAVMGPKRYEEFMRTRPSKNATAEYVGGRWVWVEKG